MKLKKILLTTTVIAIPVTGLANEQGPDPERRGPNLEIREKMRERLLQKFDQDGDGKLSKEERAAAKKARQERHAEAVKAYDTDGDGKLSRKERKAAMQAFRAKVLEEFDADGDGKLSKEERKTAHKTLRERGERPPFPPRKRFLRLNKKGELPGGRPGGPRGLLFEGDEEAPFID